MAKFMTEDEVRTEAAEILGLCNTDKCISGVGQLTTFNQLGFRGVSDKPDGWHFPATKVEPAIILETKSSDKDLSKPEWVKELQKNVDIAKRKYDKVIGILYNGCDTVVYKDGQKLDLPNQLFAKEYYLKLYNENLNKYNALFICTILKKICSSFNYSKMLSADKLAKINIKLPAQPNGTPDWDFIGRYISAHISFARALV